MKGTPGTALAQKPGMNRVKLAVRVRPTGPLVEPSQSKINLKILWMESGDFLWRFTSDKIVRNSTHLVLTLRTQYYFILNRTKLRITDWRVKKLQGDFQKADIE